MTDLMNSTTGAFLQFQICISPTVHQSFT